MTNAGAVGLIGLGEIGQVHAAGIGRSRLLSDAVTSGQQPPVTGAALETMRLLYRIYDSAAILSTDAGIAR